MKKHKPMNRTELELAGITGSFKGKWIKDIEPMSLRDPYEIRDFITVVMLYNAEQLDDMQDTQVARQMLSKIGITEFQD
jgi:hypothetical protein